GGDVDFGDLVITCQATECTFETVAKVIEHGGCTFMEREVTGFCALPGRVRKRITSIHPI
ncbi:MAG: hypothetical protein WBA17_11000, partial [Saprospiraceae bacterium]